jgi:hypothetical protein
MPDVKADTILRNHLWALVLLPAEGVTASQADDLSRICEAFATCAVACVASDKLKGKYEDDPKE